MEANTDPDTDPDPDPIRIQSGSRALMTKNLKKITAEKFFFFFLFIKALDPDWIRIGSGSASESVLVSSLSLWIRIRNTVHNPDEFSYFEDKQ